jgi:CheY-like chemotaxis protein
MRLITPRLLITDDDRDFRETIAGALADRGFETLQAANGEEALEVVSRNEVHLLLLDQQMPRLSGLDTIALLRPADRSVPLPWILISGALDEQIVAQARAAAAFSILQKPIRWPDLTGTVTRALAAAYDWRAA